MHATAEKYAPLQTQAEGLRTFDVAASVTSYRYDLEAYGCILPETKEQVYNEELTLIVEGIEQQSRTGFHLQRREGELVYFDNGGWRPYNAMLQTGLMAAEAEAARDTRKGFLAERAAFDMQVGLAMNQLAPGERMQWFSEFPYKEQQLYGDEFLGDLGFQPQRRMGFIYEAVGTTSGVELHSQTIDNSDGDAFAAAMQAGRLGGDLTAMRAAYDQQLQAKYGGYYYAGRDSTDASSQENAWDTVRQHRDLIEDFYMTEIEKLATSNLANEQLETAKKKLTYGVWAALKRRLDQSLLRSSTPDAIGSLDLAGEVASAFKEAAEQGEVMLGCGGSIHGDEAIMSAKAKDVFNLIFGKEKRMSCPFCGDKNQKGDPCSPNQKCRACQAEVRNGKVVNRGQKPARVEAVKIGEMMMNSYRQGKDFSLFKPAPNSSSTS